MADIFISYATEQLAGFDLLDARDIDDAVQPASRIPPARYGSIESRPVPELSAPPDQP